MSDHLSTIQQATGSFIAQADRGATAIVNIDKVYHAAAPAPVDGAVLARAETCLAELPLDQVPEPAGLPSGSHLPFRRNALFVGRGPNLLDLAGALKTDGTAAVGQGTAVTGLGGIGKTQLVCEFVYRYGQFFQGGVFWLACQDPAAVPAEIAACGRVMNLHTNFAGLPLETQVALVAAAWHSPLPRLLVFDNCEDEAVLEAWAPKGGGCRVLLTARRAEWRPELGVRVIALGILNRNESVALLLGHRPDLMGDLALDAIAAELGDLPLALHLAGAYMARYRHAVLGTPAAYLEAVRRSDLLAHRSLIVEGHSPTGHEQHVARTFALSWDRLQLADQIDMTARAVLARAAWFAAGEPIPRTLLRQSVVADETNEEALAQFEDALARLGELGLVTVLADGSLVLHQLLAVFVRGTTEGQDEAARTAVEEAVLAETNRLNGRGDPRPLQAWQSQLRAVAAAADQDSRVNAAWLLNGLGVHFHHIADSIGAQAALERALAIIEHNFGTDNSEIATVISNLGAVQQDLGNFAEARTACERALAINERIYGSNHASVLIGLNNLGLVLLKLNDLRAAQIMFEQALCLSEAAFGPEHPIVAGSLRNLSGLLMALDNLTGARVMLERALKIYERAYGPNHLDIASTVNNLGLVLHKLGDIVEAKAAYEQALAIDERIFGPDHPNVADKVNNLGLALHDLRDLTGARAAYERAIAIDEHSYGPDHINVANRVNNLGGVLHDLGDLTGARTAFERALAIDERSYGPDHTNVAIRLNNLGRVLHDLRDLTGARAAYERALAIDERSYGPDHTNVAIRLNNLGGVLKYLGDLTAARALYERALCIFEKSLGKNHQYTQSTRHNLRVLINL